MKKVLFVITAVILSLEGCSGVHTFRNKNAKRYPPLPLNTMVYYEICRSNRSVSDYYCEGYIQALGARKSEYDILGTVEIDRSRVAEDIALVARREALKMGGNLIIYKESIKSYTGYYSTGVATYQRKYYASDPSGELVYYYIFRLRSRKAMIKLRKMNSFVKVPRKRVQR